MSILLCEKVTMGYEGNIAADDISFSIDEGDYLCIVGENGSGKSTLMKGILGLLKPMSGNIEINGIKSSQIGYLPQQTIVQKDFPASVNEVVLSGCLNSLGLFPFYTKENKKRASENISKLGLDEISKKSYRDLSGGQQQRVLLARALCATDKLIVLDEPVTGLDPVMTANMYQIISDLNKVDKITIVMVSHDIHCAVKYASKILHMNTKSAFFGTRDEYLETDFYKRMLGGDIID